MELSRPEYWSGQPFPSPGDLPNPGIVPRSPALQADSLPTEPQDRPKNTEVGSLSFLQQSSQLRNWPRVSCISGGSFTNWAVFSECWTKESLRINGLLRILKGSSQIVYPFKPYDSLNPKFLVTYRMTHYKTDFSKSCIIQAFIFHLQFYIYFWKSSTALPCPAMSVLSLSHNHSLITNSQPPRFLEIFTSLHLHSS